ncbi:hypothetical protein Poli38472_001339 [Pythium oligandrum]|uniref:Uncharacterized protein n=1 Tax=Pythium oligandrum TaxID=41045 RepID=A0A8K1CUG7_PYTOL|nr:hypothetical protein Poli38472_001339 [Pythium oligandrum]|eukprot:TMW69183.1 hypothetical protein Poli38472_001339 [Pythium oligandrum]
MGSATLDSDAKTALPRLNKGASAEVVNAASNGVAKWRIAPRIQAPLAAEVTLKPVDVAELHPLTSSGTAQEATGPLERAHEQEVEVVVLEDPTTAPHNLPTPTETTKSGHTEVVALREGELDPLGALMMDESPESPVKAGIGSTRSAQEAFAASASSSRLVDSTPPTIKQLWKTHKDRVLAKYSTETFKIKASMLELNDLESEISYTSTAAYQREDDSVGTDSIHVVRKSRARLEQLERRPSNSSTQGGNKSRGDNTVEITQSEYVARIKTMEADLVKAWNQNQKVQALRIAIKCVKQLSDTSSAPQLYPCAFVLVSDILDTFGNLVFERIKARASEDENGQPLPTPLGESFTSDEVNIQAKETCRNWFYKIACIRELLPRIYIEIALLKCYRFLCDGEFPQIVARLASMIKGVGEPMVALYTRLYLALASTELVNPGEKAAVLTSLYDYFFAFQQYQLNKLDQYLTSQQLTHEAYLALHSPAIEWLMKCAAHSSTEIVFEALLSHYREFSDNSMVLKHLCESFGPEYYALNPIPMLQLMRLASPSQYSKCHLYSILAIQLSSARAIAGGSKEEKLQFLNEAWASITSQEKIEQYMECAAAYMKLIVAHYTHREAMILLKDVVRHLNSAIPDELTAKVYNLLGALIENVVYGAQQHYEFFRRLIPSGEFLTLMGMFRREASVGVAKKVLQAFVNTEAGDNSTQTKTNNLGNFRLHVLGPEAAVAHTLFVICCRVHDALDSLSTATERFEATKDITGFISRLGYTKDEAASDIERQEEEDALLMLYIDCRSAFYKLEPIKITLTKYVLALAVQGFERLDGSTGDAAERRRTFIKSCLAYAHITIPSISDLFQRLELTVLCGKVSLLANCLPQMDAFLKSAIMIVAELDYVSVCKSKNDDAMGDLKTSEDSPDTLLCVLTELTTLLIYAPTLTDDEPFYFVDALRRALFERMQWPPSSAAARIRLAAKTARVKLLLVFLQLYGLWGQSKLPHRLPGVDSNDVLYGGDDAFQHRAQAAFSSSTEEIAREIEAMAHEGSDDSKVVSTELMLLFIMRVAPFLSLDEELIVEVEPSVDGSSRRPRRQRSGAILLRKCLSFAKERLQEGTRRVTEPSMRAKKEAVQDMYGTTRVMLQTLTQSTKKRTMFMTDGARHALTALEEFLHTQE